MENATAEIAQISFFLAKEDVTVASVLDPRKDVMSRLAARCHDFEADDARCRFIYFETRSTRPNPPWLNFINEKLPQGETITFRARSSSANGILLVTVDERTFAATFGRSAASFLDKSVLEPDFGIRTAMNMCGNEEIRQTRSQSHAITPTQIDRQVGKPSDTFVFGLSEAEDLRYISAHMKGDKNITLQGRESLTVKILGANKLTWELLVTRCKAFLEAFGRNDYATLFPNYKNFRQASEVEANQLDEALLEALRANDLGQIQLGIPEFVSEEEYSFSYSNSSVRENAIYAFLDVDQLNTHLKLEGVTISRLKAKHIYAYSHVEDRILPYRRWKLYNCLVFEKKIGNRYFVLNDGHWLEVDRDFYKDILRFVEDVLHEEPCEPLYAGIDISDHTEFSKQGRDFQQGGMQSSTRCHFVRSRKA